MKVISILSEIGSVHVSHGGMSVVDFGSDIDFAVKYHYVVPLDFALCNIVVPLLVGDPTSVMTSPRGVHAG